MVSKIIDAVAIPIIESVTNIFTGKVTGYENLPKKGGYIIAANHDSYLDHLLIAVRFYKHLGHRVHFLAKKELFDNSLKKMFHEWSGAIPLDREAGGKEALKWGIKSLKEGKIIAIHPEGTRSLDGKLQRGKTGVARLALHAKVPIVPLGLRGTFEILPKGKKIPKLKKADLFIGKPMSFEKQYGFGEDAKVLRKITTTIMKEIAKLTKEDYLFDKESTKK
ncbi:MAG: lysophospholipid acyltransferase family protein [Nanoarchaeota archaeon]|nr:lysophospholipid acyltransferase family protein [Nanoarchaeota archaeon]